MLLLAPVVVGAALPGAERRLAPSADECTVPVPGGSRGTFVRSLTECTERYSSEVLCNGYNLVLTRVDRKGLDFWDVLVRIKNSSADAGSAPQTAIDGLEMSQVSHNAAYFCSSEGKLIMYGGRIRPHDTFRGDPADGHYPGLLRYEGDVSASGVKWSDPLLFLTRQRRAPSTAPTRDATMRGCASSMASCPSPNSRAQSSSLGVSIRVSTTTGTCR